MVAAESPPPVPAPHAAPAPDRAHPTYTKMITHALTGLGGCSERSGIADYIHDRFSGLPPSHDALLSAHLRRLVAEGVLRTDGADSTSYSFGPPPPAGEKRGPGRPPKESGASTPVATPLGEKRGPGRPRKDGGASTPVVTPLGEKRGPGRPRKTPVQSGGASSTGIKRGPGRPRKSPAAAMFSEPGRPPSYTTGSKRGPGRPRKEKPWGAATSPTAVSRRFKRGCGRLTMDRALAAVSESRMEKLAAAAAAMYAETGDAASTGDQAGGGLSRMEKLAAAVAAMSAEGTKRGRGRPRKVKPPSMSAYEAFFKDTRNVEPPSVSAEGTKRGRGRPRKVKPPAVSAYEAFFRDMMAEANTRRCSREEDADSVSGEKTQTEEGVAPGEGKETRAADAGRVPVSGENAASAPVGATYPDLGPVNLADAAASTGIKRPRGRPRKYPAAAADDGVPTGVKRPREKPAEATSVPETGDAASTGVKRGVGRPRKYPGAASTGVKEAKRGRGRPMKRRNTMQTGFMEAAGGVLFRDVTEAPGDLVSGAASTGAKGEHGRPMEHRNTVGTGFVEAAGEVLFRDMTEAPGDPVSGKKTQTEDAAPGYREETRVAGTGQVPVSGENAASAHVHTWP